jgi:putative DNA primase/helicase
MPTDDSLLLQKAALRLIESGVSVIATQPDSKKPALTTWLNYQQHIATASTVLAWFGEGSSCGLAAICGAVSGNMLLFDFDRPGLLELFRQSCQDNSVTFPDSAAIIESRSGGNHIWVRCESPVGGNQKLARSADGQTILETRGEGGYALTWPTPGYKRISGALNSVPVLSEPHMQALLAIARLFDEHIAPDEGRNTLPTPSQSEGLAPGADYNLRGDYESILEKNGWNRLHRRGDVQSWTRPGKAEHEISATTGYGGTRMLYVFSTNCMPFEAERKYDPFGVYARLEFNGDLAAAARELKAQGFGATMPVKRGKARTSPEVRASVNAPDDAPAAEEEGEAPPDGESTEFVLSQMWARSVSNEFCFVEGDQWWRYDRDHWKYASTAEARRSVQEFLEQTGKVTPGRVRNVVFMAESMLGPVPMAVFNSKATWIPLANGVYDVETGEILPHDPKHRMTHIAPYEYSANAVCPIWEGCLRQWMLDVNGGVCQPWIDTIQEWFGYSLIPDTRAQVSMLWNGEGGNGKGVATRVLEGLVGRDYTTPIPIEQLHNEYTRAELHGKLVGFVNEPDTKAMQKNGNWFKAVVGGDPISARRPTEKVFTFVPTCRIIISTNELPSTRDMSLGYWRRLLMIDWRYNVPPEKRDADLDDKLRMELPGIFNWAIAGLRRFRERRKFLVPEESRALLDGYKLSQDSFGRYLEEECDLSDPYVQTASREVYREYRKWAEEFGLRAETETAVGLRLGKRGCKNVRVYKEGVRVRCWEGIALRPPEGV